nr:hypothetical protein [uncultured Chryseobacterium sp.]
MNILRYLQHLHGKDHHIYFNYVFINSNPTILEPAHFQNSKKVILISGSETASIIKNNEKSRKKFYRKFQESQGLLTVSKIGFDNKKTQALVYYGNHSHYLAGAGYLAYIKIKGENSWN